MTVTRPADEGDRVPWQAAAQVVAAWTRFARVPAQPTADRSRDDELVTQSG